MVACLGKAWEGELLPSVSSPFCFFLCSRFHHRLQHTSKNVEASNTSGVSIVFSNGPAEDESVTGLKTVTFALSGSGTIDSILVEIAEVGSAYATVTNLTGSPWLFNFDSTSYTNGTYTLRATGWDTDVRM